ncbi:MAG: hypothetical protein R3D90_11250 [Paracoccaceae bacterium]
MLRALYDMTLRWSASRHADKALAVVSFTESSVFPIPADVLFLPMCLSCPDRAALCDDRDGGFGSGGIFGWAIGVWAFDALARPLLEFYGKEAAFEALRGETGSMAILVMLVTSGLTLFRP